MKEKPITLSHEELLNLSVQEFFFYSQIYGAERLWKKYLEAEERVKRIKKFHEFRLNS